MTTEASIVALLARQAAERGGRPAFTFLSERGEVAAQLTFGELDRRARALAVRLLDRAQPGDRAVLMFQPGLDVVVALFGCLVARIVAVPLMLPRRAGGRDSSAAVLDDCAPRVALVGRDVVATRQDLVERFAGRLALVEVDATSDLEAPASTFPVPSSDDLALLQYTSGSTSSPKGVMVGHGNMLANLEMIRLVMGHTARSTTVGWVPLYHDMGLVMQVMEPLYVGSHSVLMPPASLMQRPLSWLQAIAAYRAEVTCAPNFAFDLCVDRFRADRMDGIDLSSLQVALNGAEPVQARTLARFAETFAPYGFAPSAMYPGYGLAEATLLVSGLPRGTGPVLRRASRAALQEGRLATPRTEADTQDLVACGRVLEGELIAIVAPATGERLPSGEVGEIWVSGPNVSQGYWGRVEATEETFAVRITGEADGPAWLRTGDLGVLSEDGALYVTGRMKDLIIVRGVNHYPQDIERTAQEAHPALKRDGGAAFAVADAAAGTERLVVVHEVERTLRHGFDVDEVAGMIRAAVTTEHEVAVHEVALIRPSSLPRTTSGKVQRSLARQLWMEGTLRTL